MSVISISRLAFFHMQFNLFSYKWLCGRPLFDVEAKDNWEMGYLGNFFALLPALASKHAKKLCLFCRLIGLLFLCSSFWMKTARQKIRQIDT